jgi:hypothetical protein
VKTGILKLHAMLLKKYRTLLAKRNSTMLSAQGSFFAVGINFFFYRAMKINIIKKLCGGNCIAFL